MITPHEEKTDKSVHLLQNEMQDLPTIKSHLVVDDVTQLSTHPFYPY